MKYLEMLLVLVLESRQGETHKNTQQNAAWVVVGGEKEIEMPFFFGSWAIGVLKGQNEHHQVCMEMG